MTAIDETRTWVEGAYLAALGPDDEFAKAVRGLDDDTVLALVAGYARHGIDSDHPDAQLIVVGNGLPSLLDRLAGSVDRDETVACAATIGRLSAWLGRQQAKTLFGVEVLLGVFRAVLDRFDDPALSQVAKAAFAGMTAVDLEAPPAEADRLGTA